MKDNKDVDITEELINDLARIFKGKENLPEGKIKESVNEIINKADEIAKQNVLKK